MCLEVSKQAFSFLQAFANAGKNGLDHSELVERMEVISIREFGSDLYVFAPIPLMRIIRQHIVSEGIKQSKDGYEITNLGKQGLALLIYAANIKPKQESLASY